MSVGFATGLDVDLDLVSDEGEVCIVHEELEAVMEGIINAPCGCRQTLCLSCYDRCSAWAEPGMWIWCYLCPKRNDNAGRFEEWVKV